MLDEKWIPTPLIKISERPVIPIVEGEIRISFRCFWIGLRLLGICFKFFFLTLLRRLNARSMGRTLADFCQENGILWIKLGQLMSMRSDIFPGDLCEELGRLQDRVEGFSSILVEKILEQELGGPLDRFFSRFDMEPCAAASIAQVHRAFLKKEKIWVAIKVRRPEVDKIFSLDMRMIRFLLNLLNRFSIMDYMRWPDMLLEIEQVFFEELDYRYEVTNQQRLRKTLALHNVYVPKVFDRYCTQKVLVMEYIDGVTMSDFLRLKKTNPERTNSWLEENQIQEDVVGEKLFFSYLRQVLEDNLFHADLHPGNIVLLRENQVSLLDFGSMGTSEGDLLRKYDIFLQALSSGQHAKAVDVFLLIMPFVPPDQLSKVKDEMQRRLHAWDRRCRVKELEYNEKSTNMVFDEMMRVVGKYGVTVNWAFFKILRGWTTMDTSLRELMPEADLSRLMQSYIHHREKREFKRVLKQLPNDLIQFQKLIDYPSGFSEMSIYRGASVRRLAQVFEGTATRVSRLIATAFEIGAGFFFIFAIAFVFIFLSQHTSMFNFQSGHFVKKAVGFLPVLDPQVWLLLIAVVLKALLSLAKLARRFRKQA